MMTPLVLVHGGGFDSRCWDLLVPHLTAPTIAVDLPGRGRRPGPLQSVTFADCARAITADVDAAGFDEVVLVGHSLGGCSLPRAMALLRGRVRHAVFLAAMVPEAGTGTMHELRPGVRDHVEASRAERRTTMDPARAKRYFGNDLGGAQFAWCLERLVPEAEGLTTEPVDLAGLRSPIPRTWVRTMRDAILPPEMQARFAARLGDCQMIDLDAGHMCMISQPAALAKILHGIAGISDGASVRCEAF
ncbi:MULTISPECIES: alpha/beta fold hydrolase [Pseudofrankia]|uniref:alpha/beta fold hydrolase n=1 Tax=Pseudofrankia TaxID=2994363 RepID=UPI000234B757|nr:MULTISPECIES: alpha/beta hydrolase [Pseudofrankia]OHV30434.1 alpha/beta hydrolase [Pseudofrankia sp. EUN1h]